MDTPEKKRMTKEEKRSLIIRITIYVIALAGLIVSYVFYDKIFGEKSVFNSSPTSATIVNTVWQHIPEVIKTLQIIIIAYIIAILIKLLIKKVLIRSNRSKTILNLMQSFIKWIIAITSVILVLAAWGVDTTTLLASAGILTLVIGLGAQSLVADIVAGVFIVFEGEYQVGDIVVIEGWRGTVIEIGIRVTKIEDAGGNIQIINNSEIKKIINQTVELSLARCVVSIEYDESIPRVEIIIRDNLEAIRKAIPGIVDGPFYKGVNALSNSSVDLLLLAKCKEEDIYQVQRDLNRELKLLFDRENVRIPFSQIVVHKAEKAETKVTKKMEKEAKEFVTEQGELSKDIQENNNV